eukprot:TRINITY_DN27605_c0_g1_i1.p1 TRINITY_DN27605_c0_g1~~TRINITY_DN27605_c0_g1_i1.p1  ORF type:complete len:202 (-),score=16.05 TRINITY_DN27605_c0_g1_i1:103-681(-)
MFAPALLFTCILLCCAVAQQIVMSPHELFSSHELGIDASLVDGPSHLTVGSPIMMKFKLTNPTKYPVYFLSWYSPFDKFCAGTYFAITHEGKKLSYGGLMITRAHPKPAAYMKIPAHGAVEAEVDLRQGFGKKLTKPGKYEVWCYTMQIGSPDMMGHVDTPDIHDEHMFAFRGAEKSFLALSFTLAPNDLGL